MTDEKQKTELVVVSELPQFQTREFESDGKKFEAVLINEALKEILETVRELKKGITG